MTGTAPPNQYNIHEAKTHFSRLIDSVERGQEVLIARDGRPVARLVPIRKQGVSGSAFGVLRGRLHVPADFDAPLPPAILKLFHASPQGSKRSRKPPRTK